MPEDRMQPEDTEANADEIIAMFLDHNDQFLLFDEAICCIAFGDYQFPGNGPRPISELFTDDEILEHEATRQLGRYELAEEQLLALIAQSKVRLYGRLVKSNLDATVVQKAGSQFSSHERTRRILPGEVEVGEFYEDDGQHHVGERWYDCLVVGAADLESVLSLLNPPVAQQVHDRNTATGLETLSAIETTGAAALGRRRGRPREWDWDDIHGEIVRIANTPDGLPEKQAALQRTIMDYCQLTFGKEPSPSTVSEKIAAVYRKLDRKIR